MQQGDDPAGHSKVNPSLAQRNRVTTTASIMGASWVAALNTQYAQKKANCAENSAHLPDVHNAVPVQMGGQSMSTKAFSTSKSSSAASQVDQASTGAAQRYPSPISDDGSAIASKPMDTMTMSTVSQQQPPKLGREPARKYAYVDSLVDMATLFVESLWPLAGNPILCHAQRTELNRFLTTTIRISKTSLSTLQLALFYCLRLRRDQMSSAARALPAADRCPCPRLNFLSALILASKFLQDRNFSNRAWSKISGVPVAMLNLRERQFLRIIGWNLTLDRSGFFLWAQYLERFVTDVRDNFLFGDILQCRERWQFVVERQLVEAQESNLLRLIAVCGSPLAGPQLTIATQQPMTRAWPLTPSVSFTEAMSEHTPCAEQQEQTMAPVCPFFDEFVKTTPKSSPLVPRGDDQVPASTAITKAESDIQARQGDQAQYPTPASLEQTSPCSSIMLRETLEDEQADCPVSRTGEKRQRDTEQVEERDDVKRACVTV
jgi:hypothetical protein